MTAEKCRCGCGFSTGYLSDREEPEAKTLIRLWRDGFREELPAAWVDWNSGRFQLDDDEPAALAINRHGPSGNLLLTVESTEELVWSVDEWRSLGPYRRGLGVMAVSCRPYLSVIRSSLASDAYLVEVWLAVERDYWKSLEFQNPTNTEES